MDTWVGYVGGIVLLFARMASRCFLLWKIPTGAAIGRGSNDKGRN
jgi:hypothetical protein